MPVTVLLTEPLAFPNLFLHVVEASSAVLQSGRALQRVWPLIWSYAKYGPAHLAMYGMGRFNIFRNAVVALNRFQHPPIPGSAQTSVDLLPVELPEAIAALKAGGAYEHLWLAEHTVRELSEFADDNECQGDGQREYPLYCREKELAERQYGRRFSLAWYRAVKAKCPAAARVAHDPVLWEIARGYFGAEPCLIGVRMWWSFATDSDAQQQVQNGQSFHFDIDGYRSVSFFFYLTEVDRDNGAHIYVQGSHRQKRLAHLMSLHKSRSDDEIQSAYPPERIRIIRGKAGQGFAEDTFCFHRGLAPRSRDRLMFQVRFGLRDYGTGHEP